MLFDSHSHIHDAKFDKDRDDVCRQIEESELEYVMTIGCNLEDSVKAIDLAKRYEWCYATVGVHPHDTGEMDEATLLMIKGLARKAKVQAIGEIGLDYHYDYSPREEQQHWFRRQVQMALELSMPIVIHDREANDDVMRILKEEGVFRQERLDLFPKKPGGLPDARLLLHCYSGSKELALQYVKLGATISIAGPVTYKNARKTVEVVEAVDLEHLLIETDCPYLTPEPLRGKRNQPAYVEHTAAKIAEIKGITYDEVGRVTCENAMRFFHIE